MPGRNKRAAHATLAAIRAERDALWERQIQRETGGRPWLALGYYILDGRALVRAPFIEWASWFERASATGARIVKQDRLAGYFVSTVFLGIDHQFGGGPPLLFETMVFDERDEGTDRQGRELGQWRWSTYAEAEAGHAHATWLAEHGAPFEDQGDA